MNKKTIFTLLATLLMFVIGFSQKIEMKSDLVSWDKEYKVKDSGTRIDYIGTIADEQIFALGYYNTSKIVRRFNKIGFIKAKNGKVITETENQIDLPLFSLQGVFTNKTNIVVLYNNEDKQRNQFQLKAKFINPQTLKQQKEKTIISFTNKKYNTEDVSINRSKNKSYFSTFVSSVEEKSQKISITTYLYDDEFDELWSSPYITQRDEPIAPVISFTSNNGYIYILSAVLPENNVKNNKNNVKNNKEKETTGSLLLARIGENSTDEYLIEGNFSQADLAMYELNEDEIFIATSDTKNMQAVTYKISQEKIMNTIKFAYQQPENTKEETWWNVSKILPFENGNLAVVVKDNYIIRYANSSAEDDVFCEYADRNFTVLTIDPHNSEKPLYNTMISRAVLDNGSSRRIKPFYQRPLFFMQGNDFYAIYNTDSRDNDLSGTVFTKINLEFSSLKKVITDILHISEDGKATVTGLFSYHDHDVVFADCLTHLRADGKLQIGSIVKKIIVFGDLDLKNLK